jgi:penicillin-binding protein 1C
MGVRGAEQARQAAERLKRLLLPGLRAFARFLRRHPWQSALAAALLLAYMFSLPHPLFKDPLSLAVLDREGRLLGARIAADGQWRFPESDSVPGNFARCLVAFEDKRFYQHPGFDPIALARALRQNLRQGAVVSGGSTLSMQVIRLMRKNRPRTAWEKLVEIILATRLELGRSKSEILALYASHAPFGGNVVGLEAASWRYFGRPAALLSWAEAATLAVLPNAPGLIHPGRNRSRLLEKRNRLLSRLLDMALLDSLSWRLALTEPLPERPYPLPDWAPHLTARFLESPPPGMSARSTLDLGLQQRASEILLLHHQTLRQSGIYNAAALIVSVESGEVLAYVGNVPGVESQHSGAVDLIRAPRSSGSILKPFLYAAMLHGGELLPDMLTPDVPSYYSGFTPANFDHSYSGAVPAHRALARSLNVPAVRMLNQHGVARFHSELRRLGMRTLFRPADDYGLTLVLGGAESTLEDLAVMYGGMARSLLSYLPSEGRYPSDAYRPLTYLQGQQRPRASWQADAPLRASAIWLTFDAMERVTRPGVDAFWEHFSSSGRVAWKTGTSFGFRDAWAVGVTPRYVIAAWAGNADGEGRPELVGGLAAAPLLFDLFGLAGAGQDWFEMPYGDMAEASVCRQSGHLAGEACPEQDKAWIPLPGLRSAVCPYHRYVFLDPQGEQRVTDACYSPADMRRASFFILPAVQEVYYRNHHPDYRPLPPLKPGCEGGESQAGQQMDLIYPKSDTRVYIPRNLDGSPSGVVFRAIHRDPGAHIFWHLDEQYIGKTEQIHKLTLRPDPGLHVLTLVDGKGETLARNFEVVEEESSGGE